MDLAAWRGSFVKAHPRTHDHMGLAKLDDAELFTVVKTCGLDDASALSTKEVAQLLGRRTKDVEALSAAAHTKLSWGR
jgi:hypothetical protein